MADPALPQGPYVWATKDPQEEYEYEHDWTARLLVNGTDVGDTLRTSADPDPAKRPSINVIDGDVVPGALVMAGNKIQYWMTGGTLKSKLEATVWTVQGRKYQAIFILPIKQV